MKKIIAILIILLLAGIGVYFLFAKDEASDAPSTAKVEKGPIRQIVSSTGRVISNLDVDIKCKASGEVIELPFDVSDTVKQADLLLVLNPVDEQRVVTKTEVSLQASQAKLKIAGLNLEIAEQTLETDTQRAQSQLKSAQARAKDDRAKADRVKQLLEKNLASQEEYDSAETLAIQALAALEDAQIKIEELKIQKSALDLKRQEVELAKAQVETDKIALAIAQDRLRDTKVAAPIDAVVTTRNVQTGQIISSGISNVGGGTTVLTLSDLSRIFVLASVDESDIGKIQLGQTAKVTADAFPGKVFTGAVTRIAAKGVNVSNVVTFEVKLEIVGELRSLLKPEMTANIEITTDQKDDTLLAPVDAIAREDDKYIVNVLLPDGTTKQQHVEIGISDNIKTEILSGLKAGDTVLVNKGVVQSRWNSSQQRPVPASRIMFTRTRGR